MLKRFSALTIIAILLVSTPLSFAQAIEEPAEIQTARYWFSFAQEYQVGGTGSGGIGPQGIQGVNGTNGLSCTVQDAIFGALIICEDGTQEEIFDGVSVNGTGSVQDGKDGKDGVDGKDGKDGINGINGTTTIIQSDGFVINQEFLNIKSQIPYTIFDGGSTYEITGVTFTLNTQVEFGGNCIAGSSGTEAMFIRLAESQGELLNSNTIPLTNTGNGNNDHCDFIGELDNTSPDWPDFQVGKIGIFKGSAEQSPPLFPHINLILKYDLIQ